MRGQELSCTLFCHASVRRVVRGVVEVGPLVAVLCCYLRCLARSLILGARQASALHVLHTVEPIEPAFMRMYRHSDVHLSVYTCMCIYKYKCVCVCASVYVSTYMWINV